MLWTEFIKKCKTGYPASIPQIVAHIQKYLTENPIQSEEDIEEKIETEIEGATETITDNVIDYLEEHPEILPTITVDSALSSTSENPVQNKVIKDALDNIPALTVDSSLSSSSENPVQNKVITNALASKLTATEVVFNVATWSNDAYWPSGNGTRPLGETANVCSRAEITQDADSHAIVCSEGDGFVLEEWSMAKLPAPVFVYVDNNKIWVATRNTLMPSSQITIKGLILHRG